MAIVVFVPVQNVLAAQDALGNSLLSTNSPFVLHLANPPWIKHMVFVQSRQFMLHSIGKTETEETWTNMIHEAAIQPSGIFDKELTPMPFVPDNSGGEKRVTGISDEYFWTGIPNMKHLMLSPRKPQNGAANNNLTQKNVQFTQEELEEVRFWGLPALRLGSLKLHLGREFEAVTVGGAQLSGKILAVSNDRPVALEYRLENGPAKRITINYRYNASEARLPNYFEYTEERNGAAFRRYTNWVHKMEFGLDDSITNGFKPSMFYTNLQSFAIASWSNGVLYSLRNGKMEKSRAEIPKIPEIPLAPGQKNLVKFGIIFSLVGGWLWFLINYGWRMLKKSHQTSK